MLQAAPQRRVRNAMTASTYSAGIGVIGMPSGVVMGAASMSAPRSGVRLLEAEDCAQQRWKVKVESGVGPQQATLPYGPYPGLQHSSRAGPGMGQASPADV